MINNRVKIRQVVENQLPNFLKDSNPQFSEFLIEYFKSAEVQGAPLDILNNIDQYTQLENLAELVYDTSLTEDVSFLTKDISVESTQGFPQNYGLIQIGGEVILYESKNETTLINCSRGFSGITSYRNYNEDSLIFTDSNVQSHNSGQVVYNLSNFFLAELYQKFKSQYAPGFDTVEFYSPINEKLFLSKVKDFYSAKGTTSAFSLLFKSLYGTDVSVIKPRDFIIQASDADYRITRDLVVEKLSGDPEKLVNLTLFQDETSIIPKASGSITNVEEIYRGGRYYYQLSLDYNPDIEVFKFTVHPNTRLISQTIAGQTYLDVDSTVGFPHSGSLFVLVNDVEYKIDYTSKSTTQFLGCTGVINIPEYTVVKTSDYAYGIAEDGEIIKVRVTGVLSDLEYPDDTYYYTDGDEMNIVSLGKIGDHPRFNSWVFNVATKYNVKSVSQLTNKINGAARFRVVTYDDHIFTLGDPGLLTSSTGRSYDCFVISVSDKKTFDINLTSDINLSALYQIQKKIARTNSLNYLNVNDIASDVQNTYIDNEDCYVCSPSLPNYYDTPLNLEDISIEFSGSFEGEEMTVGENPFYTGDAVYYLGGGDDNRLSIQDGLYFIKKLTASKIKLATSRSNISNNIYVPVFGTVTNNKIGLYKFFNKKLNSQKIIRKISPPLEGEISVPTLSGQIGILNNGVEILNYKSNDFVYYGELEEVLISSPGTDYDVLNPPVLHIQDKISIGSTSSIGAGATGVCNVVGSLKKINIIDKGYDYTSDPIITISGGNGIGARAKCNLSSVRQTVTFSAGFEYNQIDLVNNTIGFNTDHKFRDYEKIIYKTSDQTAVGGLSNNAIYFASIVDERTIKLHVNYKDSILGINTVPLLSYGQGIQSIESFDKKKVISSIEVIDGGKNYSSKKTFFKPEDVNIFKDTISIKNHGYKDREVVNYTSGTNSITGLSTSSNYYIKVVDKDTIKLCLVGVGSISAGFYYDNQRYVEFEDQGLGSHSISYPPIVVKLEGTIGVSTVNNQDFQAKIQPIFRGSVESISLSENGSNYGDPMVINYVRQPLITLLSGESALASPVVSSNGEIIDVIINNRGRGYNSPPTLYIDGDGFGAILTPIIKDGNLISIKVINGGSGYKKTNTFIRIVASGLGAKFESKIKSWNINLVERLFIDDLISADDGILSPALNQNKELSYTHGYVPREFRKKNLATALDENGILRYRQDLTNDDVLVKYHSPIIGWAYDGNPIYGPYGYSDREGGAVKRMQSGYRLRQSSLRPPGYDPAFFVEDYVFVGDGDLDIHNGRFCKTPEFPNGIYAYFSTIEENKKSSGPFNGYLKPYFPYFIGNLYKSLPIDFNYYQFSDQDSIDLNEVSWQRNTFPHALLKNQTFYEGFIQPNKFTQKFPQITVASPGPVDELKIVSPGDNYSVNDNIFFDNSIAKGTGAYARIVEIAGRDVENIQYSFNKYSGVDFVPDNSFGKYIGFSTQPHQFSIGDVVSVQNLNILSSEFTKSFTIGISTNILSLTKYVPDSSITGIVTYFNVTGSLSYPEIVVNDILGIGTEQVKVLEIDKISSRIKVRRQYDSTLGFAHSEGVFLRELPRKFYINVGYSTSVDYKETRELYFSPDESVCIPSENLLTYSTPQNSSPWTIKTVGTGATIGVNFYNALSPDGTPNATKVVLGIVTSGHIAGIANTILSLATEDHTGSIFLRGQNGGEKVYGIIQDGSNFIYEEFTLTSSWKRYSFTGSANAGSNEFFIGGWGPGIGATINGGTFYVWGSQVERGTLMSPFVKTNASNVNRSSETTGITYFSNPGNSINQISIPFKGIYLPAHNLQTGVELSYKNNGNTSIKVSTATSSYRLPDNTKLYVAKLNDNFIGISSVAIGIGTTGGFIGIGTDNTDLLYNFSDYGSGLDHSFIIKSNNSITGDVYKKSATITTKREHDLQSGDEITVRVTSGIQTNFVVKYDSINRRMVVNPKSFSNLDVDVDENKITIVNHGFVQGQKVIYNSSTPSGGLENAKIYYVIVIDDNTVKLSPNYYENVSSLGDLEIIDITTASFGSLSPINPELKAIRNSTLIFDVSDPTLSSNGLPSFDFDFYIDKNFKTKFFTTEENTTYFNVRKEGIVGEPNAVVKLILDQNVDDLFYALTPIYHDGAPAAKTEIIIDDYKIINNSRLSLVTSNFDATATISGITTNTFNYSLVNTPEKSSYSDLEANISYSTGSKNAIGPVYKVALESRGRNYRVLPNVASINSGLGTNAIFLPASKSLGRIFDYEIRDIGFDYPSDLTLRPSVNIPSTYKIEPLSKFKEIKIISPGVNYFVPPQLIVLDGFTGRLNTEVDLRYKLGDTQVTIVRNTTGLYNVKPKIIPVNNPNGTRISRISFNQTTKEVTVGLAVTYSSLSSFPFTVGEKVIIENTNIDLVEGGKGYNSANYGYKLFVLTEANANIGGEEPTIKYSLADDLVPGEDPGIYDAFESFGAITPEKYFPTFDIKLEKDTFRAGEIVTTDSGAVGVVQIYDQRNEYLKVRTRNEFKVDDLLIGSSSGNKGLISSVDQSKGIFNIGSNSVSRKGWRKETGYLNNNDQRIHDNDYYQYFSYALKSPIDYETWNPLVSNLNHTSGFKKFGQLTVDSEDPGVGINTDQNLGSTIAISDLISQVNLNSVKDFDVAREKSILIDDTYVSNEIIFRLPFLQKYQEFIGNRVLKVDDISDQFDNNRRSFELYSNRYPIFKIVFNGSDSNLVSLADNTVNLGNHYFVSAEEIEYIPPNNDFSNAIQIAPTSFPGIGVTTFLPSSVYVVKVDNQKIKFASSPENALLFNPSVISLTSVGIGSTHIFRSKNQNTRLLVTMNGTIQSPIVSTSITSILDSYVGLGTTTFTLTGISSFFGGDLLQINNEIVQISAVSVATSSITVFRSWMGTEIGTHAPGSLVTKLTGNYNIVDNTLNFSEFAWGNLPIGFGTTATSSNDVDYSGLTTSTRFSGRVFLRSALNQAFTTSYVKAYDTNYVFDDISPSFNGITTQFTLTHTNGIGVSGISQGNAIILINDIFQGPQRLGNALTNIKGDYKLTESSGSTVLGFTGAASNFEENNDINVSNVPRGGIIVSVGSTNGLGFQPLVAAGGTAIISAGGTVQSISIGNSGSGYRVGIQTIVNVGVQTYSDGTPNITFVGFATVLDGHVVDPITITNPGSGFTSTNPPQVIFDGPLSYSNIPLIYSAESPPNGIGTGSVVDIVVGQGSSVINFEFKNYGYGYGQGDILTLPIGGPTGIPTDSSYSYKEFQIYVDKTYQSKFSGWSVGDFIVLDNIDQFFNGRRRIFPLSRNGERVSFFARRNSGIDLQSNLLVFMNDTLQIPGEGYRFTGGSVLRFSEPPRGGVSGISTLGDRCKILMYTGTQTIDVKQVDVLPTIKVGDDVQLYSDVDETFNQEERLVVEINAADSIITNNYAGQGVTNDELLERPITWIKQTVDKFIDEVPVGKDRVYYEPNISPTTNIIQSIGLGSTSVYVYSVRPFFDNPLEAIDQAEVNTIEILGQDGLIAAAATCAVSIAGTVSSITITNPGYGYTIAPTVTIQGPGVAGTVFAQATASIADGKVTSIGINTGGQEYFYGPLESISIASQGIGFPKIDPLTNTFVEAKLKTKTGYGKNGAATISLNPVNYSISSIQITNGGYDYKIGDTLIIETFDNVGLASTVRKWALTKPMEFTVSAIKPPQVLISPPARKIEEVFGSSYFGDYGEVVGVGTTNVGISTGITFDFFIPLDSQLRRDYAIYNSGISTGDYFSITYSNLGDTTVSLKSDNSVLGIGSTCLDNVYEVISVEQINRFIPSAGITTSVIRVLTSVGDYNGLVGVASTEFYGVFNWGKINMPIRTSPIAFNAESTTFAGIHTNPIIRRLYPLKYLGYFV